MNYIGFISYLILAQTPHSHSLLIHLILQLHFPKVWR